MKTEPTRHVMVDIETLDTEPTAVVLSAAVGEFFTCPNGTFDIGETREWVLPITPQIEVGRTISGKTLEWWAGQRPEIFQSAISKGGDEAELEMCIQALDSFIRRSNFWGNGATFDNVIMRHLMRTYIDPDQLWKYRQDRCYRTIQATFDPGRRLKPKRKNAHRALDDVLFQIQYLKEINDVYHIFRRQ